MAYTKYSLTPASNNAAPPDGAPEGMLPSAVNDTMRDMMSQIRDCGDGIRGGTYTMTAPVITGGSINGATVGATTATTGKFTTATATAGLVGGPWTTATRPASPATGQEGFNSTLGIVEVYNGSAWFAAATIVPTITVYTSGSGTYTTPTGAKYLFAQVVGAGGGGASGGTTGGSAGGTGGTTTFGTSLLSGVGGAGNSAGGTATGGDLNITGGAGVGAIASLTNQYTTGGTGGSSFFGGGRFGGFVDAGATGLAYGSGGGGGGISTAGYTGNGGGAGGYLQKTISSPNATYSYAVGAGGTAGVAQTGGFAGGVGAGGVVVVTAYF